MSESVETGRDDEPREEVQAPAAEPAAGAGDATDRGERAPTQVDERVEEVEEPVRQQQSEPDAPAEEPGASSAGADADVAGTPADVEVADTAPADAGSSGTEGSGTGTADGEDTGTVAPSGTTAPAPRPAAPRPRPAPGGVRPGPAGGVVRPPSPEGRPAGRPGSRSAARRGGQGSAPAVTAEHAPDDTAQWGRVAEDGVVHVRTTDGERVVGSYPDVPAEDALAYFGRRFADLVAQLDLVDQRLSVPDAPVGELRSALAKVQHAVDDAGAVGDLAALGARVDALGARVTEREREANIAREQARTLVRAERVRLVEEAEALAETDPAQVQWKASGERLRTIFDEWREQQRAAGTARLPKGEEDELWRRLKHARNRFERHRRHHFAELDAQHGEAKTVKEALITEAEALSGSTDWGPTSTAYRQLMDRWKAAPRASRKEDDALWARFRAAQDVFFGARDAKDAEQLAGESENLAVKEQLLVEAEAILPVRDPRSAAAALRDVQDRWDAAGRVPRSDLQRVEKRMRAVEQAVRDADSDRWRRTNPEARARAEGALGQLQDSISDLEHEVEQARSAGDERKVRRAQEALDARRAWLEQVERAAADFGG